MFATCPQLQAASAKSTLPAIVKVFTQKVTNDVTKACLSAAEKKFKEINEKLELHNKKIEELSNYIRNLISSTKEKEGKMNDARHAMNTIIDTYRHTLKSLFPPAMNLNPLSKSKDIVRAVNKLQALMFSLFPLIPGIQPPEKPHIYLMAVAIRRIIGSERNEDVDINKDISLSELKAMPINKSRFFYYEGKIHDLEEQLNGVIPIEEVGNMAGRIIGRENPQIKTRKQLVDLLQEITDKYSTAGQIAEEYNDFKEATWALLRGIEGVIPASLAPLVQRLIRN
ncbi:hypothetical protein TVAG_021760 [Trichomonas vaginalis G3]|uniref:Uncharacterized protein n=1 Tax=Trichomonas vaginalis (strain ATCC PRA-98 / G3) TaxID=412133 RepID=A2DHF6_TRIV3|nr:biological adhesion protein [Trichomonas vaginalis G3]EAY20229.1 hypothetical protein TVAG_021760 [Trichomonas vaginalis G3]KAI5507724.1 biological adhesion protein [Trichomonas vaginalis G3]|eukprot:XP_001581215.1 hypothetical protein [Trichomonas vaginalis G3]